MSTIAKPPAALTHPAKLAQLRYAYLEQKRVAFSYLTTIQGHCIRVAQQFYMIPLEIREDKSIIPDKLFYTFERKPGATPPEPEEEPLVMRLLCRIIDFVRRPYEQFTPNNSIAEITSQFQALMPIYYFMYTDILLADFDIHQLRGSYEPIEPEEEGLLRWARGLWQIKTRIQDGLMVDTDKAVLEKMTEMGEVWNMGSIDAHNREREVGRTCKPEYDQEFLLTRRMTFVTARGWRQLGRRLGIRDEDDDREDFGVQEIWGDTRLA